MEAFVNFLGSFKKRVRFFSYSFLMTAVLFTSLNGPLKSVLAEGQEQSSTEGISADEFLASDASRLFKEEKYEASLNELDSLLKKYPKDALLLRYKAIALDRLGRSKEAIAIFEDLKLEHPDHAPTLYFLAQAYYRAGEEQKAVREWQTVAAQPEEGPYRDWAVQSLGRVGAGRKPQMAKPLMRWNLSGRYGYEYDSNVILKPDDKSLATASDRNAGRQTFDFGARYRTYSNRDVAVDLLYGMSQSVHDDSLNEFNFHSEEFGINARKRVQLGERDYVLGARYDLLLGILEDRMYSVKNRWHLSADTRYSANTRTVFYDRITQAEFILDGDEPSKTSRDGFYNDAGITNYWYFSNYKRYFFARQEFNSGLADGKNFDMIGSTSRLGVHTPLAPRLDFDFSSGLELGFYPNFSSIDRGDLSRRRDMNWDLYTSVTYKLTDWLGLRAFYRYINGANQNNVFDYQRHIGGVQLVYSQDFK